MKTNRNVRKRIGNWQQLNNRSECRLCKNYLHTSIFTIILKWFTLCSEYHTQLHSELNSAHIFFISYRHWQSIDCAEALRLFAFKCSWQLAVPPQRRSRFVAHPDPHIFHWHIHQWNYGDLWNFCWLVAGFQLQLIHNEDAKNYSLPVMWAVRQCNWKYRLCVSVIQTHTQIFLLCCGKHS